METIMKTIIFIQCCFAFAYVFTQNPSASFDISTTTGGFLPPKMTTIQRDDIDMPEAGMLIFNQSTGFLNCYDGQDSSWYPLQPSTPKIDIVEYFLSLPHGLQTLLSAGETPLELMKTGVTAEEIIGNIYAGGIIFYLDSLGKGLVVTENDLSTSISWGCDGIPIDGADGHSIGTGLQNTLDIVAGCLNSSSAKTCLDLSLNGFADWYLPSKDELDLIWKELADSDGDGINNGSSDPNNIGGLQAVYWSSSELNDTQALFQSFSTGIQGNDGKESFHSVRAIRTF